jgi:hypothetical protein
VLAELAALLDFLDGEPQLAQVCLVETFVAGPAGLGLRARELQELTPLVDAGGAHAPPGKRPHTLRAVATIVSVAGILHARLVTGEAPPFIDLLAPLADVVLSPYLDPRALRRAIERAERLARSIASERASHPPPAPAQADVEIPRRVRTLSAYRARQCLLHLAEHPGSSNAQVAQAIDVRYQGQMSILLTGLEDEGLLSKRSNGTGRANEWRLTPHGESVARAIADEL